MTADIIFPAISLFMMLGFPLGMVNSASTTSTVAGFCVSNDVWFHRIVLDGLELYYQRNGLSRASR